MALQMMGPFTGNLLPVMDLHQPACLICLASTECFVQLMHVTYVLPVTQVHHIYIFCLSYTKPTASEAGCPVSSTYMVRFSYFGILMKPCGKLKTSLQGQQLAEPPRASFQKGKGPVSPHHSTAP